MHELGELFTHIVKEYCHHKPFVDCGIHLLEFAGTRAYIGTIRLDIIIAIGYGGMDKLLVFGKA